MYLINVNNRNNRKEKQEGYLFNMGREREIMSFDDIVFENRNKEYGAYLLRKKYNALLLKALISTIVIVSASVIIPYLRISTRAYALGSGGRGKYVAVKMENFQPPPQEIIIPPEAPPPPPAEKTSIRYTAPAVVDTVMNNNILMPTIEEARESENSGNETFSAAEGSGGDELFGEASGEAPYEFFVLEVPPKFRGGDLEKFREWLQKRVIYPPEAQAKGIQGKVYLTFVVERDGTVTNVNVVKGVDKMLDEEAKRAIESSPQWSPGLQKGRPVRVRFSIFLNFTL